MTATSRPPTRPTLPTSGAEATETEVLDRPREVAPARPGLKATDLDTKSKLSLLWIFYMFNTEVPSQPPGEHYRRRVLDRCRVGDALRWDANACLSVLLGHIDRHICGYCLGRMENGLAPKTVSGRPCRELRGWRRGHEESSAAPVAASVRPDGPLISRAKLKPAHRSG